MSGEATLPIPQPAIKADISKLVAFAKGFPDSCNANLWPADPEEACTRHALFLGVWFKHGALSKPVERQAMKEANHKLTTSECKLIVNQIHECKNFLRRKWKNLKTGEKTSGLLMGLMQSLFGTPQPAERPVRRLNQKTPKKKALQPAEEKPEQGPAPITFQLPFYHQTKRWWKSKVQLQAQQCHNKIWSLQKGHHAKKRQRKCQPAKGQVQQAKPRHVGRRAFPLGLLRKPKLQTRLTLCPSLKKAASQLAW